MRSLHRNLTVQVLFAISLGVLLGLFAPGAARGMRPVGDTFVNLVRMVIAPVIFLTIMLGIANMRDLKKVGRVGGKALLYFEIVTTFALAIGLIVVNVTKPGAGLDVSALAKGDISRYAAAGKAMSFVEILTHIVPSSVVDAFARGDVLQVVFFAVLFGMALATMGERGQPLVNVLDVMSQVIFRIVGIVMMVAPIGAFGAMAYTVGNFGAKSLLPLGAADARRLHHDGAVHLRRAEPDPARLRLLAVALPQAHPRGDRAGARHVVVARRRCRGCWRRWSSYGCARSVVGLVIPAGYSFNLDGTSIYLSMAALFVAQAFGIDLSIGQQLSVLGVLMLTSKGAAGVTGSGFIVLASTLSAMRVVPVEGVAILLGVDRFMSEARAITNLIGNGVATLVIARSENAFVAPVTERRYRVRLT